MIGLRLEVLQEPTPQGMQRAHNRAMRIAHFTAMEHWRSKFLPLHFKRSARSRYGHTPRKGVTRRRKHREGKRIDNVDTGEARTIALRVRRPKATRSNVRLRIPGPFYFRLSVRKRVNSAAETTTILPAELQECVDVAGIKYLAEIQRSKSSRRQRI